MKDRYYVVRKDSKLRRVAGEVLEEYRTYIGALNAYMEKYGLVKFTENLYGRACGFEPGKNFTQADQFKKEDKRGDVYPRRGTEAFTDFKALPEFRVIQNVVQEFLNYPCVISYKSDTGSGSTSLACNRFFTCLVHYEADGPMCIVLPCLGAAKAEVLEDSPDAIISDKVSKYVLPKAGLKEVTKPEWDLILAKHRVKIQKK